MARQCAAGEATRLWLATSRRHAAQVEARVEQRLFFFVILHRQTVWDPAVMDTSITNELNPTSHRAGSDSHFEPAGMGSLEYYFSFSVMLQFKQAAYHLPLYLL